MKSLRLLHMYLGCAFAPLLVFFVCTGFLQTYDWHEARKDGTYRPPAWAAAAASVHMHQRLPPPERGARTPRGAMRAVIATLCVGLLATVSLGVVMAWQLASRRRGVILALAAGTLIPIVVITLQRWP